MIIEPGANRRLAIVGSLLLVGTILAGCNTANDDDHGHGHIVYHHRPADFKVAVFRLEEIHQILMGDAPLPAAKQFEDRDHDHEDSHRELNPQSTMNSEERLEVNPQDENPSDPPHIIEVDIFQELFDIVRWLPTIAADSDLPKSEWDQINAHCQQLGLLMQKVERPAESADADSPSRDSSAGKEASRGSSAEKDSSRNEVVRAAYREQGDQIAQALEGLQAKLSVYEAWHTKIVK